jgi:DNA-binding IclR family transcriptional regulator
MNPDQPPVSDDLTHASGTDVASKSERGLAGVIKSAKRVLELFEYFAECRRPLTVGDVVKGLNYPQSSVSSLMKSLTRLGYLDYNRHDRVFMPTLRVAFFGGWIHDQVYSENTLSGVVDGLHRRSDGHTVLIGMQNDVFVQYIHLVQAPAPQIPWYIKPGSLRPLCRSASGRILLSLKTDVEVQQLLWRINAEEEVSKRMTMRDLLHELNLIRVRGYALTLGTTNPHTGVIAVQLPTPPGQPRMALGIGGPISDIEKRKDELLGLLREAVDPYHQRLKLASGAAAASRDPRR